LLTKRGVL